MEIMMKTPECTRLRYSAIAWAAMLSVTVQAQSLPDEKNWARWVLKQVSTLPYMQSQAAARQAADFDKQAVEQPLFNPTLGLSYEHKDEQQYNMTISRTLDWSGKRKAQKKLAQTHYAHYLTESEQRKQQALSQALQALVAFHGTQSLMQMVRQQEMILNDLSALIAKRQRTGDLGQVDVEMAYLSLSESLQKISAFETSHFQAQAQLADTLDVSSPAIALPDARLWLNRIDDSAIEQLVLTVPAVINAQQWLEYRQAQVNVARLNKKADPTIGVDVGKEGEDNYLGLQLAIPLNVSSRVNAQYSAASSRLTQAQLMLQETLRKEKNKLRVKQKNYRQLSARQQRWQTLMQGRMNRVETLLKKQWHSGDVSTAEYLFALQKHADAITAGIKLTQQMQNAWIDWLLSTGQIETWLTGIAIGTTHQEKGLIK